MKIVSDFPLFWPNRCILTLRYLGGIRVCDADPPPPPSQYKPPPPEYKPTMFTNAQTIPNISLPYSQTTPDHIYYFLGY